MSDPTLFQYCKKLVILRNNNTEVLLARRVGEADFDQIYTLLGGKLETTDGGILEGMARERDEELGADFKIAVYPNASFNRYFIKSNGQHMIVPHYYAEYVSGDIVLNDEHDDYKWVRIDQLDGFEPIIENIPELCLWAQDLAATIQKDQLIMV